VGGAAVVAMLLELVVLISQLEFKYIHSLEMVYQRPSAFVWEFNERRGRQSPICVPEMRMRMRRSDEGQCT
jgi:hypothetical protein